MNKFENIRERFPGLKDQVYLDTATTGLLSRDTYEAIQAQLDRRYYTGIGLGEYFDLWNQADAIRDKVARLLGAQGHEIFYGKDCSDMLNALTANLTFSEGANVIVPDMSFPSTRNAWLAREKDGLEVRYAKSERGGIQIDDLLSLVDHNTIALSLCLVEPSSGYRYELETIGKFCNEKGILLVVDATQCLSAMAIDVKKMGIDFLAASTYKWMTNVFGFGIGYMHEALLKRVHSRVVGWVGSKDRIRDFAKLTYEESESAARFETGGLNWIGLAGFDKAVDNYLDLGKEEVEKHILDIVDFLYEEIVQLDGFSIVNRFDSVNRSNIVYLRFPESLKLNDGILFENGIRAHVAGKETMRIGVHFYNNRHDIKQLIEFFRNQNEHSQHNI